MDAATAALVGAFIGVCGGGGTAWVTGLAQRKSSREARREDRRATAYLAVATFLFRVRAQLRTFLPAPNAGKPFEDFKAVVEAGRSVGASVYVYGSQPVRDGFEAFFATTQDFGKPGENLTQEQVVQAVAAVERAVNTLIDQMEIVDHPRTAGRDS